MMMPAPAPRVPPMMPRSMDSITTTRDTWLLSMPMERRMPISRVRSSTDASRVTMMPRQAMAS